nr:MAG TPA: hypothetical protein [Bacteriophage sp.]DAJ53093.1 MAG TPA: hypothetical protein [Caudoviricetes sp.]
MSLTTSATSCSSALSIAASNFADIVWYRSSKLNQFSSLK